MKRDSHDFTQQISEGIVNAVSPILIARKIYFTADIYIQTRLINHAASAAFYFLLSVIPLTLLAVLIFDSYLAGYSKISNQFFELLNNLNPKFDKKFFEQIGLLSGKNVGSIFGTLGVIGLVWSSRSIFSSVKNTFAVIFAYEGKKAIIHNIIYTFIFVPSVFAFTFAIFLLNYITREILHIISLVGDILINDNIVENASSGINIVAIFFIAFITYRFLPTERPKSSNSVYSAIFFTIFMIIIQYLLNTVFKIASFYLVYGVISTMIISLFAVYVIFALFYFFAEFTYVNEYYSELEFSIFFGRVFQGKGNIIERILFLGGRLESVILKSNLLAKRYKIGDIVYNIGDSAENFYIVKDGTVYLKTDDEVVDFECGSFIGVKDFLANKPFTSVAVAKSDCIVLSIPRTYYERTIKVNPTFANSMLEKLVG